MTFSITLLACDIRAIVRLFEHILETPFLVLVYRLTPSIVMARPCFVQICWHTAVNTFIASSYTSFNSFMHQHTPNQTDPINQLRRAHQTAVFRLRTHQAPLNAHLHRIKKEHPANYVYCPDSDETVEHFLFNCPLYDNIRSRLLSAQPNIHNTL